MNVRGGGAGGPTKTGRYRSRKDYMRGERIPVVIDGQRLDPIVVDDILP